MMGGTKHREDVSPYLKGYLNEGGAQIKRSKGGGKGDLS